MQNQLLDLLSIGRNSFTKDEVGSLFGMTDSAFKDASRRAIAKGRLLHPRRGFYVVVAPQDKVYGAPPPYQIIDDLMQFENASYHVGLLKAAEIHGASHQAVMAFQVVSSKRMPSIELGRSVIDFYFGREPAPSSLLMSKRSDAGYYKVSSPALTAAELLRYLRASGSLDAAASVIGELAGGIDAGDIDNLSGYIPLPTLQRLGYILQTLGAVDLCSKVEQLVGSQGRQIELDILSPQPDDDRPMDDRWKVVVRKHLDLDEDTGNSFRG